jgi:hypothetical protein
MRALTAFALLALALASPAAAQVPASEAATRSVRVDPAGVIRWRDTDQEVALFGANYCVMSGSDYRIAGLVSNDRKAMIDEDMAQFARMGWTGLRLCSWGDWENADAAGNLVVNEHVDLLDYVVARAKERGIYMLLTPIHTYNPAFADQMNEPSHNVGFSRYFERAEMGTNPKSIAAQANYIRNLLAHVNPYTGIALRDDPAIPFVEVINEPVHHPADLPGSIAYINTLVDAMRASGSQQIAFYNVSQDFAIGPAIQRSKADGVSFGWYPSSLGAGYTLQGNFLQSVDGYPDMLRPELNGRPRIVYEFDQPDLLTGYMYPAMARTFRSVGAQFAAMFAYDMLQTAPYNLGWQTHYLNLVHTPRKAVSAAIAAEAMRRLPRMTSYPRYPGSTVFGDFRVSYEEDSSVLNATDAFMNAGATAASPRDPKSLTRIVGLGPSGVVDYEGTGAYFLDKVRDGVWRLEVYPDQVLVRDPFGQPRPDTIVSRLLYRAWPFVVRLPDLGTQFVATAVTVPGIDSATRRHAVSGSVRVEPGVWLLSRADSVDRADLPARISRVAFDEFHVNARVSYPDFIGSLAPKEYAAGTAVEIRARVANTEPPDEVRLWVRPTGTHSFGAPIAMRRTRGNDYAALVAAERVTPGRYDYVITGRTGTHSSTFPGGISGQPGDWPFHADQWWSFRVTPAGLPLRLFDPKEDAAKLLFVRPGEQYRAALFQIVPGESADEAALKLALPDLGKDTPERYAAALYVGDAVVARSPDLARAESLEVLLRAIGGARKTVDVTLVEKDGSAWVTPVVATDRWSRVVIPLAQLRISRSIHIPSPYPGLWNYWRESPPRRGAASDHLALENVERLQLLVHANRGETADDDAQGAAIQSVRVLFGATQ